MAEGEKKFPVAVIVALVVVGLILAGGISYFIATKIVADQGTKTVSRGPSTMVKLGDPKEGLIVNIGGVNNGRFLKISVVLEVRQDKKAQESAGKSTPAEEIKMLDTAVHVLRSLKPEEFDPAKQDRLKELLKQEINKSLGEDRVYEVFVTNLVIQ